MTLLTSWAGIDTHGVGSIYIASDSRFSYDKKTYFDFGKKVFASNSYPDIFGYAGDVLFPTTILSQIIEMIDSGVFFNKEMSCDEKNKVVYEKLNYSINKYPQSFCGNQIDILHISRDSLVSGYPNFHAYKMTWTKLKKWTVSKISMPQNSDVICTLGSGKTEFINNYKKYQGGENMNTSRNVFHCFCDTLYNIQDNYCGGAPQLIGCYRKPGSSAFNFGVVYNKKRYFLGAEVPLNVNYTNISWRNENFEIVNGITKKRKESAAIQSNKLRNK